MITHDLKCWPEDKGCICPRPEPLPDGTFDWKISDNCEYHATAAKYPMHHGIPWNCPTYYDGCNCDSAIKDLRKERDRLRDENERAAQLAVEATHLILRLREERERLRAELDDSMARLIAAARDMPIDHRNGRWEILHFPGISPVPGCVDCAAVVELRAAIDYAEQRRAQYVSAALEGQE